MASGARSQQTRLPIHCRMTNSSFDCPRANSTASQRGVSLRPAQVSPFGPRYVGATGAPEALPARLPTAAALPNG